MRLIVTGGAGFIGANLCRHLENESWAEEVVALDDLSTGRRENLLGTDTRLIEGSILDIGTLDSVMSGADAVIHLAARPSVPRSITDPIRTNQVNVDGTLNVLESARRHGVRQVLVASSSSVYGSNPTLPKSEDLRAQPMSPYAVSKLAAEQYALSFQHVYGISTLAFRFFNVFGPLQAAGHAYAAVIPAFVASALKGQPATIHGDGRQTRDFTFVGTVVEVLADAVRRGFSSPEPINLAFGSRSSLLEVFRLICEILGEDLSVTHTDPRPGDVRDSQADQGRMRKMFPHIEPASLEAGLRATIEWHRSIMPGGAAL